MCGYYECNRRDSWVRGDMISGMCDRNRRYRNRDNKIRDTSIYGIFIHHITVPNTNIYLISSQLEPSNIRGDLCANRRIFSSFLVRSPKFLCAHLHTYLCLLVVVIRRQGRTVEPTQEGKLLYRVLG